MLFGALWATGGARSGVEVVRLFDKDRSGVVRGAAHGEEEGGEEHRNCGGVLFFFFLETEIGG